MGTNVRYADAIDRRQQEREIRNAAAAGKLQTLTPVELQLRRVPLTIDPAPRRRVRAWVRFGDVPFRVDAIAERWTDAAVGVSFKVGEQVYRCWVWASAVDEAT